MGFLKDLEAAPKQKQKSRDARTWYARPLSCLVNEVALCRINEDGFVSKMRF